MADHLRAVGPDEKPPSKPRKLTVSQAAASGDHRDLLVAMRERVAKTVSDPECPPRDLAALTRRLQDIAKEIEAKLTFPGQIRITVVRESRAMATAH